jgi:hypothetical protein
MNNQADRDYYAKRIRDERMLAESSADTASARTHADLAARYERLLAGETKSLSDEDGGNGEFTY